MNQFKLPHWAAMAVIGVLLCLTLVGPPSCALTPEQRAVVVPLANIGLAVAESQGVIRPGDSVTLGKTVAIITSDERREDKLMQLTELGLQEAVDRGVLKEGTVLNVQPAGMVQVVPPDPGPNPAVLIQSAAQLQILTDPEPQKPPLTVEDAATGK